MNENRDEDERLRSVTLQNAQAVFLARQRAEEELGRTQEALRKQSDWLRVTLASIGDAVMTTDLEGKVMFLNGVAETLTGWTLKEAQGRPLGEVFRVINEATREPVEDPAERALHEGCIVGLANHTILIARDGSEIPIDDSASPIRDDQGQVYGVVLIFRSIAERRKAEEIRARLAAIVESSQDAIISKTLDGRIDSWNAAAENLFGYSASDAIGRSITLIIPPERHGEERVILEKLRRGERIEHYETVRVTKEGRRIDVALTISPIRDSAGRIIGASKISRDITSRKRAEQRLATQNDVTHALAVSAHLHEAAPRILRAICEHLEWQVGVLWTVHEHEDVLRCVEGHHLPGVCIPRFEATSRERAFPRGIGLPGRVWADGKPAWIGDLVQDSNFPRAPIAAAEGLHSAFGFPIILNADVLGVLEFFSHEIRQPDGALLQMMTAIGSQIGQFIERKRAEEAVRESEARFRTLADHAPVLIWLNSPTGCVFVNRGYLDFLGLEASEVEGMKWARYVHPDDYEDYVGGYTAAVERRAIFEKELRFRRADGVYRWMKTVGTPRFSAAGEFLGYVGCTFDITEIKQAEQALRDSEHRFRLLAEMVPSIIWTAAPDGTITYANERWFEYCGVTP